jgi:hypothetical protein
MARNERRFILSMVGVGVTLSFLYGCANTTTVVPPVVPPVVLTPDSIHGLQIARSVQRDAKGGGYVTVDIAVLPGPLPVWNSPPASAQTIGWLSNRGEAGKREKRYDLKPDRDTVYQLEISADPPSTRTKWTLYELHGRSKVTHRSGHLWECDGQPHPVFLRDINFRDCLAPVTYDPAESALVSPRSQYFLASYSEPTSETTSMLATPVWISCTSGCCSLGT